ncbi:hypothetical protein D915_000107 [Fasciola hepatica]|uniref:Apple domain-containing protein n=1 Tax=Fasciola hepatica TaxID=6192 RepID=A0A4E0RKT0_FASHE|nr:hypothetical protein D915_000107 [Fasciola hepatica]
MLVLLSLLVLNVCYSNIDAEACYDAPTQNKLYQICGGKVKFVTETTFWYKSAVRLLTLDSDNCSAACLTADDCIGVTSDIVTTTCAMHAVREVVVGKIYQDYVVKTMACCECCSLTRVATGSD